MLFTVKKQVWSTIKYTARWIKLFPPSIIITELSNADIAMRIIYIPKVLAMPKNFGITN